MSIIPRPTLNCHHSYTAPLRRIVRHGRVDTLRSFQLTFALRRRSMTSLRLTSGAINATFVALVSEYECFYSFIDGKNDMPEDYVMRKAGH